MEKGQVVRPTAGRRRQQKGCLWSAGGWLLGFVVIVALTWGAGWRWPRAVCSVASVMAVFWLLLAWLLKDTPRRAGRR
jgi:hypothetical protein